MKRKNLVLVLIALLLLAGPLLRLPEAASAQAEQPTMRVTPAFSGYFKYGEWLPVWVELENQGRDLEAEVRISINASQGLVVFSAPVSLPGGSRKRLPVYVLPNNFARELDVQLVSQGSTLLSQRVTVRPQANITYVIGLLSPARGALSLLNGLSAPGQAAMTQDRPKVIVDLTTPELPDRAEGLRSFDLLVLNDLDTSSLTPEQAAALATWVEQGGRLVIGGGAGAASSLSGLPERLQPIQLQETIDINQAALAALGQFAGAEPIQSAGPFSAARVSLKDGATLLAGDSNLPLVVERSNGAGVVDFVALDLSGVPFNGWPGTSSFWQALLGQSLVYPQNMPFDISMRQMRADSLTYPLSNIPSLDLPSVRGLAILLLVYIVMVGPVNYVFLRWRRRLHLAWVTIPVLTVLFTAASFAIGYTMRGNDLVMHRIALVELSPARNTPGGVTAGNSAAYSTYLGLFSPRQQSYEVTVQGESLLSPMGGMDFNAWGGGGMAQGGEMVFTQSQPARVRGLTVNQWSMQSFMAEGVWSDFGQISGDLRIENEVLVGTVRNDTSVTLKDAVLVLQTRFVRLGELAPGAEVSVDLGLSNLAAERNGTPIGYRLFHEQFQGQMSSRLNDLRSNIYSTVFESYGMGKTMLSSRFPAGQSGASSTILVFGWIDQAPPTIEVPGNRLTQQTTGLVYTYLDYQLPASGVFALPPGMIPGELVVMPPNSGICGFGTSSVHMGKGQAEFLFQTPGNLQNMRVDTLKLSMWRDTGDPFGAPQVALYDWTNESWFAIQDPISGTNVIQKAAPYVSPTGAVRVQVTNPNDVFGCIYLDLGLEASPAGQGGLP